MYWHLANFSTEPTPSAAYFATTSFCYLPPLLSGLSAVHAWQSSQPSYRQGRQTGCPWHTAQVRIFAISNNGHPRSTWAVQLQTNQQSLLYQAVRICAYTLVHPCQLQHPKQLSLHIVWLKQAQQQLQLEQNTHLWHCAAEGLMHSC